MQTEAGFSLVELLVALFVLSVGLVSLGSLTGILVKGWDRSQSAHTRVTSQLAVADNIFQGEQKLKSSLEFYKTPTLTLDDGTELILASPKIDQPASCTFDLVGRRCR